MRFAPDLRIMASGGAPLSPELSLKLEAMGWLITIGYGLTETSSLLTIRFPGDLHHDTVGRPVKGVQIRIDSEALPHSEGTLVPSGQGEILAKGPNIFSGYLNLPDQTDRAFTPDGWFRTGDLGFLDAKGYIHLTGRFSTLIVTKGGENIQPDDIEAHLSSQAAIQETGVLQLEDGTLAAVIVPEIRQIRAGGLRNLNQAVQQAIAEASTELPSYQRINDFALTRTPLPRTRLGKIQRHLLAEIFQQAKSEQVLGRAEPRPVSIQEMAAQDRELLEDPAAARVWNWLAGRYRDQHVSPDTSPELDLGIDSLEWLNITLEIRRLSGVELEEETVTRIATIRDILHAVTEKSTRGEHVTLESPLEKPEELLTRSQLRRLEPPSLPEHFLAGGLLAIIRFVAKRIFHLHSPGLENIPAEGPLIITPNHVSYLDAFAVAAALGFQKLRRLFWAGFAGTVFKNPFFRYFSRLSQTVPIDPDKGMVSTMAFGAAVLNRRQGLVWFPEGMRSPDGRLQPFKSGVGLLLEHYPVPVIPTFIWGTEGILPPGKTIPRPGKILVVFGRPLSAPELAQKGKGKEKKDRIASALHEEVASLGKSTKLLR